MTYTSDFLIERRKKKWEELHDIEYDKKLRTAIADKIIEEKELREEVIKYPEKLIEMVFVVVDKDKKTMPFFLNSVQKEFIKILKRAIDDYENNVITSISILILKGRQQGFTTLVTAYQLAKSITNKKPLEII